MTNNPTKEDILSPSAFKHLPSVRMEMKALAEKRDRLGAPFLKRKYRFLDGTYVLLHAMIGFNKIIMWGSGSYPHIVMTDHEGAWTYDWYKDAVNSRSYAGPKSGDLKPSFAGRSQITDQSHLTYDGSWSSALIDEPHSFKYLGGLNSFEMTLFTDEATKIYGRVGDLFNQVATLPAPIIERMSAQLGGLYLFGVSGALSQPLWNLYDGLMGVAFNPANRTILDAFYWIPAFFTAPPADDFFLKPGFYYGKYPACEYDIDNPLESLTVTLKGLVNTKHTNYGTYIYGWAEYVSERNGLPEFDLHLFLQPSPLSVPANPTTGYVRIAGTTADRYITVGWAGTGFAPTVTLTLDAAWIDFELDMWNHGRWNEPEGFLPTPPECGVSFVISKGLKACAYRFTGALVLLLETEEYHSHSVSHDGTYLVLFEGKNGVITKATAWDLFGTREAAVKGEETYTRAAVTVLANATEVVAVGALTGCLIPNRYHVGETDEYEPSFIDYDLLDFTGSDLISDYSDYLPSMGIIAFGRRGIQPTFKKVVFEGLTARYGISVDKCFQSTIIIEDPDQGVEEEKLVGWWRGDGGSTPETTTIKGVVRGSFHGSHPDMRFTGIGTGDVITLSDTFSIVEFTDGTLGFEGYSGDLSKGTCIDSSAGEDRVDWLCTECGSDFTVTASSSCGQTAEREYAVEPLPELYVTGNDVIGGTYVAGNAVGVVTWSISCGSINENGTVSGTGGCCGTVTVTAVDECGRTASLQVRGTTGSWYTVNIAAGSGSPCDVPPTAAVGSCSQYNVCSPGCCYCDISSCYSAGYIYYGPTIRKWCDKLPGWGSGTLACDGTRTYTPVYTAAFYCTGSVPAPCAGTSDPSR